MLRCGIFGVLAILIASGAAEAQLQSHNFRGDFGAQSGTQPPPGLYLAAAYINLKSDTFRLDNGDRVLPGSPGSIDLDSNAYALGVWYVTDYKILGGNYSFMIAPAYTDANLEGPGLGFELDVGTGLTDTYFQPINLGWKTDRADYTAGLGVFAPTGRYREDADDNLGLGMWSFELFAGTTQRFGKDNSWNFSVLAAFETHSDKDNSEINVGNVLTLEGGLGKSFLGGAANAGLAYEAQWKLTADRPGSFQPVYDALQLKKHRAFGIGPEITFPLASSDKVYAFVNIRYMKEFGVRNTMENDSLNVIFTFPIPSVPIN